MFKDAATGFLAIVYGVIGLITFAHLVDHDVNTGAQGLAWLICIPVDIFLAHIWPLYWLIIYPTMVA